ncbi:MAG: hypothetical protein C0497_01285 [Gemmatimonas sp.]|nr:hypothetical protein [Gemmatimonas sp.]
MTPRAPRVAAFAGAVLLASACASTPGLRMQRALDASMERVLRTESYLRSAAGISSHPSRLTRGDGFVYLADVAPVLRYLAEVRDTVRFRALRGFVVEKLVRPGPSGLELARRFRDGEAFERATAYGHLWTVKALVDGWRLLGDTASALARAQLAPFEPAASQRLSAMHQLSIDCGDAMDAVPSDPAPARAVLVRAKKLVGSREAVADQGSPGSPAIEGEAALLSCLTRVGIALRDPDATVRYLDHLLDHLQPMLTRSGRPDIGTAADILLTLRRARAAGPEYAR